MGLHTFLGATALVAAIGLFPSHACAQPSTAQPDAPATQPAAENTDIPVKQVVLFSSGVGYFEHGGKVSGDAAAQLHFKTDQINDILKSLLLQDMDGGTIGTVSYPGLAPLAHTLKSFQVDITSNPDMADLLNQLRGAKISVFTDDKQKLSGVILGVEKKTQQSGDKSVTEVTKLNLKVERQFRSVNLDKIDAMELEDPALQKELDEALGALVQSRDQDKKPMTLHFNGKGERRVRVGYLVETPIWKTSYRLVLDGIEPDRKPGKQEPADPTTAPSTGPAATRAAAHHFAKLQGWALVENQTDNDWKDVQLSLVSGHPLSFIQDLYHSQYLPRPIVMADNYASLRPQTYGRGIADVRNLGGGIADFTDASNFDLNSTSNNNSSGGQGASTTQGGGGQGGGGGLFMANNNQNGQQAPIDPTSSIISAATAARMGQLFKYKLGNVTLPRQTSAMISIVTDDIDAERVSIFNAATLPNHPLLGALVKNNTGKFLLQGPITVLDHGSYAGDARIEDLPPGQERLVSFGIDQELGVDASETKKDSSWVGATIVMGVMTVTSKNVVSQTYLLDNKSEQSRSLIIEHPRNANFKLVSPEKAEETTPELLRFRRAIGAQKLVKFAVVEEFVFDNATQILTLGSAELTPYLKEGGIPQKVRDALAKAVVMKDALTTLKARIAELHHQEDDLASDQSRVRANLHSVAPESDYSKRLMKKIDEQESAIEAMQKTMKGLQQQQQDDEQKLNDFLTGLTVE